MLLHRVALLPAHLRMTPSLYLFLFLIISPSQLLLIPLFPWAISVLSPSISSFLWLMWSAADINLNQVIRSPAQLILILMLLQESVFTVCFWVKYSVSLYCLVKAANLSGFKLWNCWVTQSLGVWLRHLWPGVIAGKRALSPPLNPGNYCLCYRNITAIEHFHNMPKCTVSITCTCHCIFGRRVL